MALESPRWRRLRRAVAAAVARSGRPGGTPADDRPWVIAITPGDGHRLRVIGITESDQDRPRAMVEEFIS